MPRLLPCSVVRWAEEGGLWRGCGASAKSNEHWIKEKHETDNVVHWS